MVTAERPDSRRSTETPSKGNGMKGPSWHVLLVRKRFEQFVAAKLNQRNIENYVPMRRVRPASGIQSRSIHLPMFPGYVFCKCDAFTSLFEIPGVLSGRRSSHETDGDQDVTTLRRIFAAEADVERFPFIPRGKTVMVGSGLLRGITGVLHQTAVGERLVVSIQLLDQS